MSGPSPRGAAMGARSGTDPSSGCGSGSSPAGSGSKDAIDAPAPWIKAGARRSPKPGA